MESLQLKNKILKRISEIDNPETLKSIDNLLSTSDQNITKLVSIIYERMQNQDLNETADFTDYIKEWVKSM